MILPYQAGNSCTTIATVGTDLFAVKNFTLNKAIAL